MLEALRISLLVLSSLVLKNHRPNKKKQNTNKTKQNIEGKHCFSQHPHEGSSRDPLQEVCVSQLQYRITKLEPAFIWQALMSKQKKPKQTTPKIKPLTNNTDPPSHTKLFQIWYIYLNSKAEEVLSKLEHCATARTNHCICSFPRLKLTCLR